MRPGRKFLGCAPDPGENVNTNTFTTRIRLSSRPLGMGPLTRRSDFFKEATMAAPAPLLLSALSKQTEDRLEDPSKRLAGLPADPDLHLCVFSAESSCAEAPLTSEPPLPDAAPSPANRPSPTPPL